MRNNVTESSSFAMSRQLQIALVTFFCLVAIFYSIAIPPGEGVDEIPHLDYVRYVKEEGVLPIQPMSRDAGVKVWMGHHPPLYYALGALAISWTDTSDWNSVFRSNPHFVWQENNGANGWNVFMHFGQDSFPWRGSVLALHVMRLLTVVLGAIAIFAIFAATRLLFAGDAWLAAGATALMAFNPSFMFMSSTVHHDTLQAAIFALGAWWLMTLFGKARHSSWFYIAGGLLAGVAALTKLSGLALCAIIGLALCLKAIRDREQAFLLHRGALTFGVAFLVAGWWYIRNQVLYGDPLGWRMFLEIHSHMVRTEPFTFWLFTNDFLAQISRTFWGAFGYMHITFPEWSRYLWGVTALGIIGWIPALMRTQIVLKQRWAEWMIAVSLLVVLFVSFVRFSMATVGAGHGRYLFPAAFTIGAIIVAGLSSFTAKRLQPVISLMIAGGMLVYAIWLPVTHILPKYAPPQSITTDQLPAQAKIANLSVAQGVQLVAYWLENHRVVPGQSVPVTLYWRATGHPSTRQEPQIKLELIDENNRILDAQVMWPVSSLAPEVWSTDKLYVSQAALYVSPDQLVNKFFLTLTPILQGKANELHHRVLTELITTGGVIQIDGSSPPNPRQEIFASEIQLSGYSIGEGPFEPGAVVPIDLYWEVLQTPTADYTVFVHLLNQVGDQVSGFDRPAGGEALPTSAWRSGSMLRDSYPLTIPETLLPGEYPIQIGMYTWPSLVRLPVMIDQTLAGDSVTLTHIRIER